MPFCWAKPACFDFFPYKLQGRILSTRGDGPHDACKADTAHKLCKNAGPKPFCWAKPACFDFSSSNYNLQGHIGAPVELLSLLIVKLTQFTNYAKILGQSHFAEPNRHVLTFFHRIIIFQDHVLSTGGVALTDAKLTKLTKLQPKASKLRQKNKAKNIHTCQWSFLHNDAHLRFA